MTKDQLQNAIDIAAKGGLASAIGAAFAFNLTKQAYEPKNTCLSAGYSSGEAVVCGILLQYYFAFHGTPADLVVPEGREWQNSLVDLVWPGAWYFVQAADRLTEPSSWSAIRSLLPGVDNGSA